MPDYIAEEGIGETRIVRVHNGQIVEAKLDWHETLTVGTRVAAKVIQQKRQDNRAIAETENGETILVRHLPRELSEGSTVTIEIGRAPMREPARSKPAHGFYTQQPQRDWTKIDQLRASGMDVQTVHRFNGVDWDGIIDTAMTGLIEFSGGSLAYSPTPAMTLIDIDGHLPARELALSAVPAIAESLEQLEVYGSVGIDFPTLPSKTDRKVVDQALSDALHDYPHECTAMNGFGFVQLVSRLEGPSILHRLSTSRTEAYARLLLRRAEMVENHGALLLTCHPAIKAKLETGWLTELASRTGREVRIATDSGLALSAGFAQAVPI